MQLYTYIYRCMLKYSQHNKDERRQFFRKIYLSHFIWNGCERVYVWEGSWRLNKAATYWPPALPAIAALLPVLLGCSTGGLGAQPLLGPGSHYSNWNNWLQTLISNSTTCLSHRVISWFEVHQLPAHGVIVIVLGNEHGDTSSNPGRDWLHFT